jgi:hypothetical protein
MFFPWDDSPRFTLGCNSLRNNKEAKTTDSEVTVSATMSKRGFGKNDSIPKA